MDEFIKSFRFTIELNGSPAAQFLGLLLAYFLNVASLAFVAFAIATAVKTGLS